MKPWMVQAAEVVVMSLAVGALGGVLIGWILRRLG